MSRGNTAKSRQPEEGEMDDDDDWDDEATHAYLSSMGYDRNSVFSPRQSDEEEATSVTGKRKSTTGRRAAPSSRAAPPSRAAPSSRAAPASRAAQSSRASALQQELDEFENLKEKTIKKLKTISHIVPKQPEEGIKAAFPPEIRSVPLPVLEPVTKEGETQLMQERKKVKNELNDVVKRLSLETFIGTPVLHLHAGSYVEIEPKLRWNRQALNALWKNSDKEYVNTFIENHATIWDMRDSEIELVREMLRKHQDVSSTTTNEYSHVFIEDKIKNLTKKYKEIMNTLRTAPRLVDEEPASKKLYLKMLGLTGSGLVASHIENIVNKLYMFFDYEPMPGLEKSIADIIMLNMAIMVLIVLIPKTVVSLLPVLNDLKNFSAANLGTIFTILYSDRVSLFVGEFIDIFYRTTKKITIITISLAKKVSRELNIIRQNINEIVVMMNDVGKPEEEQVEVAGRVLAEIMKKDEMYDVESDEAEAYFEEDEKRAAEDEEEVEGNLPASMRRKGGKRRTKKVRRSTKKRRNTRKR